MTERLRVFHLIKSLGRGGAEVLLPATLGCGDRQRFNYQYGYFLPWKNAVVPALEAKGAEVVCFTARSNLSILIAANRVATHLRTWEADLLHCHLPLAGVVGRLAGKLAGVPVVYTEHNRLERYHLLTRTLSLSTWRWQDKVIAVSDDVAASIRVHAGHRVPVEVVLNGVDIEYFDRRRGETTRVREELGIPPACQIVGTVAVFRTQKRLEDWLEAARILRHQHPNLRFLLVGDGPLRAELVSHAESLDLADCIHWPGLQNDVRPYLAAMDVYMMSSSVEGLPIALLEAMSMECTVVATAVGGIPEVIRDGENGFLVGPSSPDRLAEVASRALESPGLLERCGRAARATVGEGFSVRRMACELEATYLDVIGRYGNGH